MIKLTVAGDICMRGQEDMMNAARAQEAFSEIQPYLDAADIRLINWENPTTDTEGAPIAKSGAMLHSKPQNVEVLTAGHFDVAVMANNHTGDYGPEGVKATLRYLHAAGLATVGAGENISEARKPLIIERNGERIAIISACEYEFGIADRVTPGAAGYDEREMRAAITCARSVADYVLVVFHGGNEYNPLPSPRCKARYRDIIDMGADALVGMHSHCPQGYEYYNGAPIVYGTGNFLFHSSNPDVDAANSWHYGYLVALAFDKVSGVSMELIPYQFNRDASHIRPMEGETKASMLKYLSDISQCFANQEQHESMFMGWCLIAAPGYARFLNFSENMLADSESPAMLGLRNALSCQAHNELLTIYTRMIVEGRLEEGREPAQRIRRLQAMPVNIW